MARAGAYSAYLRIEQKVAGDGASPEVFVDALNDPVYSWVPYRTVWVKIEPTRGYERQALNVTQNTVSHLIYGDFYDLDGVTEAMRLVYDEQGTYDDEGRKVYFDIEAIRKDFTNRAETVIEARQTTQAGASA
ncbi:MAG: head-tail adaptor protein [Bauldia sp.]|nr:head-tail adaptor protein [Bauldia sp.]MCW5777494.1 head-tail adaptor protein [Phycisphaeraceae bacterium]